MKRKLIAACVAVVLLVCTLGVSAMAINYDFSFTLTPNGDSEFTDPGYKGDWEPRCYITSESGSVLTQHLQHKFRVREADTYDYASEPSDMLTRAVTKLTLEYLDEYADEFDLGNWDQYGFRLACSLHEEGEDADQFTLNGRWNP